MGNPYGVAHSYCRSATRPRHAEGPAPTGPILEVLQTVSPF